MNIVAISSCNLLVPWGLFRPKHMQNTASNESAAVDTQFGRADNTQFMTGSSGCMIFLWHMVKCSVSSKTQ